MAEIKLVDMAMTPEEVAKNAVPYSINDASRYPYGLCICLDDGSLEKLGVDIASVEVGDMVEVRALAKITVVGSRDTESGSDNRVEMQICYLGTELEEAESAPASKKMPRNMAGSMYKGG